MQNKKNDKNEPKEPKKLGRPRIRVIDGGGFSYSKLSSAFRNVNLSDSQNAHSISDGQGGRIELGLKNDE
ncbi:MAG: hypothetical protein ACOZAN_03990 [Patescibacteria group bacterium]